MIPSTYQFQNICGEPGMHPGVVAEIEAARRRTLPAPRTRRHIWSAWLRRLLRNRYPRDRTVSLLPAE